MPEALIGTVILIASLIGALWGWRCGTLNIKNPPDKYNYPGGITRNEHLSILRKKHIRRRFPLTVAWAVGSGLAAFGGLLALAILKRSSP